MYKGNQQIVGLYKGATPIIDLYKGIVQLGANVNPNGKPSSLILTVLSDTSIKLDWTIGSTNQTGHKIELSTDSINYTQIATVTGTTATYTHTGLTAGGIYYYRVAAYIGSNISEYSNIAVDITPINTILADGDTVAIFDGTNRDLMTMDASYQISQVNDTSGLNNHFINASTSITKPLLKTDGVHLDGTPGAPVYLQTSAFTYNQPECIFMVYKILLRQTGAYGNGYVDGFDSTHRGMLAIIDSVSTTKYFMFAGTVVNTEMPFSIGSANIIRLLFDGVNSNLKINQDVSNNINIGTQNMGGITLGTNYLKDGSLPANYQLVKAFFRKSQVSEAEIYNYLNNKYFANRDMNIVWEGHSMINALEVGNDIALPDHCLSWLKINHAILTFPTTNLAVGGDGIAALIARKAAQLTPLKLTIDGVKNVVVVFIGTNDVTETAGTGQSTYDSVHTYIDGLITDGWTPVIITMLKVGTNAEREAQRVIYNNLIKANTDWNYIVDVDTIPELQDVTDTDYFNADQIHLVNAGNVILGQYLAAKIAEIT